MLKLVKLHSEKYLTVDIDSDAWYRTGRVPQGVYIAPGREYYVVVADVKGQWLTPEHERVGVANIHPTGEIRWWVEQHSRDASYAENVLNLRPYKDLSHPLSRVAPTDGQL